MARSIGLDLDGTLVAWHLAVYDYFRTYKGYVGTYNAFWTDEYKTWSEGVWKFITEIDIFYSSQQPTSDCVKFLECIKDKFDIYYITSRPRLVKTTTEQYLRKYKFPFQENLIFTDDKVNMARLLRLDYAIDDLPKHVEGLSKVTKVIMISQPWNKELWGIYPTSQTLMGTLQYMEL